MIKVAVTGGSGFVGRHVRTALSDRGITVVPVPRDQLYPVLGSEGGARTPSPELIQHLSGCSAVIHLAGLAHSHRHRLDDLVEANLNATLRLAHGCTQASVPRLVFVSSLAVHGNQIGNKIDADTPVRPSSDYGRSKAMAEEALEALSGVRGLSTLALRAPLVCGRGAPGNLATLRRAIRLGCPLPSADWNRRDLIGAKNLSEMLVQGTSVDFTGFVALPVCDGAPVSTKSILRCMSEGAKRTVVAVPFSRGGLAAISGIPVLGSVLFKMCSDLEVDGTRAFELLGFKPKYSTESELIEAGRVMTEPDP